MYYRKPGFRETLSEPVEQMALAVADVQDSVV
jgi:hypothetical protein